MADVLLCSETFVKQVSSISDNVAGKYLRPSILEAQEVGLKSIIGSCLLDHLKNLYAEGQLASQYKELVDRAQYFITYTAIVEITMKVSYKVGNFGVTKSNDENLNVATFDEIGKLQYYYQTKADYCKLELQQWLLDNSGLFPELKACDCERMKSNLYSAATCGLWLGGPRSKGLPGGKCKCTKR
jgi:hypothetical protein